MTREPIYWLSRAPGLTPEGPFVFSQLKAMFESGQLTISAQICANETEIWEPLPKLILAKEQADEAQAHNESEDMAKNCLRAVIIMTLLILAVACIPALGLLVAIPVWGLFALITTVLSIVMMTKGQTGVGILCLAGMWLGVPLAGLGCQALILGGLTYFADQPKRQVQAQADVNRAKEEACMEEAGEVLKRNGWNMDGVQITATHEGGLPVVYAKYSEKSGGDILKFNFSKDDEVTKIISTQRGIIYGSKEETEESTAKAPSQDRDWVTPFSWREEAQKFISKRHSSNIQEVSEKEEYGETRLYISFQDEAKHDHEWRFKFDENGHITEVYSHTEGLINQD